MLWPVLIFATAAWSIVACILQACLQCLGWRSPTPPAPQRWTGKTVIVGHRGAREPGICPTGNTLSAFKHHIERGGRAIEIDVRLTKDEEPVVFHDALCRPILDGPEDTQVQHVSLAELRAWPFLHAEDRGQRVMTLREMLKFCLTEGVELTIETKDVVRPWVLARKICDLVTELNCIHLVNVISFDPRSLWLVRRLLPSVPTTMLYRSGLICNWAEGRVEIVPSLMRPFLPLGDALLTYAASTPALLPRLVGAHAIGPRDTDVSTALVARAHAANLQVYVWVVNHPKTVAWMEHVGVDFIATDTCFPKPRVASSSSSSSAAAAASSASS